MRYVLNSAVITGPGTWVYRLIDGDRARTWLRRPGWRSLVGYPATANHIRHLSGMEAPLSRTRIQLDVGDEALVVRLKYRLEDPGLKGRVEPGPDDWEYGILTRDL